MHIPYFATVVSLTIAVANVAAEEPAQDLRLFNTKVLRSSIDAPNILLLQKADDQVDPVGIQLDVNDGKVLAATISYPMKLSFSQAKKSLNKTYQRFEKREFANDPELGLWRVEDEKCAIQLSKNEDGVHVIYISFQPADRVLENMLKAKLKQLRTP